mgnify:CR=1 FL=1|tara:strand:+ start:3385 stop:4746 length:1362 start_codon:yes stop_codon:yes gene_type:complete
MANISELSVLLKANTKQASQQMQGFGKSVGATFNQMKVGILAVGTAVAGFTAISVKSFLTVGDELGKMSKRTDIAVEELDRLRLMMEFSGTTLQGFEAGLRTLQRQILTAQQGSLASAEAFEKLGIEVIGLEKLDSVALFNAMAEGLMRVEDFTTRSALASQLLGRFGTQMNSVLAGGSEEFKKLSERAERNAYWTAENSVKAEEFNDNVLELKTSMSRLGHELASKTVPVLDKLAEHMIFLLDTTKETDPIEDLKKLYELVGMSLERDFTPKVHKALSELQVLVTNAVDPTRMALDDMGLSVVATGGHLEQLSGIISDMDEAQDQLDSALQKTKDEVEGQEKAVVSATKSWIDYHMAIGGFQSPDAGGGTGSIESMMPSMMGGQGQSAYLSAVMGMGKTKAEALNFIANKGAFRGGGGSFSVDTASVVNTFTNKSEVASIVAENKERGGEIS